MATVDKEFADNLIKHGGWTDDNDHDAPDNPQCIRITKYTDLGGKDAYGAVFAHERNIDKYNESSPYIRNPEIYWQAPFCDPA